MTKGVIFSIVLIVGLALLTALLSGFDRLVRRWRLGFLLIFFPVGTIVALLVAAAATELAATPDWTFLLAFAIAQGLVALISIRSALAAGRRWKAPNGT